MFLILYCRTSSSEPVESVVCFSFLLSQSRHSTGGQDRCQQSSSTYRGPNVSDVADVEMYSSAAEAAIVSCW